MKKYITVILIVLLVAIIPSCSLSEPPKVFSSPGTGWEIGYGQAALIPPDMDGKTYYLAGFAVGKIATGVLDYQHARAVWIDDKSGNGGVVIATVDCIGVPNSDVKIMREMLSDFSRETGCRAINIIATHCHSGVDTLGLWGPIATSGRSEEFNEVMYNGVVSAVKAAYASRRGGKLYFGSMTVPDMLNDSRPPYVFDSDIHAFRFVPDDGKSGIRIINYAAHPEALRSKNTLLSADFPAYMSLHIKEKTGDDSLYIPGAIGGLITTKRQLSDSGESVPEPESTVLTGQRLGDAVLSIAGDELKPEIGIVSKEIRAPIENHVYITSAFLGTIATVPETGGGKYKLSVRTECGYMTIGSIKVFLVPGELLPELAYGGSVVNTQKNPPLLREAAGEEFLVFGLCNDEIGYIIPPGDFLLDEVAPYAAEAVDRFGEEHYEETNSMGPETASYIVNTLIELHALSKR